MPRRKPTYNPYQSKISVQDVRDYSTPEGAAMANEEMRRISLEIEQVKSKLPEEKKEEKPTAVPIPIPQKEDTTQKGGGQKEEGEPWALTVKHNYGLVRVEKEVQILNFIDTENAKFKIRNNKTREYSTIGECQQSNISLEINIPDNSSTEINLPVSKIWKKAPLHIENVGKYIIPYSGRLVDYDDITTEGWKMFPMNFPHTEHAIDLVYQKESSITTSLGTDNTPRMIFRCQTPGTYMFTVDLEAVIMADDQQTDETDLSPFWNTFTIGVYLSYNGGLQPEQILLESTTPETVVPTYYKESSYQRVAINYFIPEIDRTAGGWNNDQWEWRRRIPLKGSTMWDLKCGDEIEFFRSKFSDPTWQPFYKLYGTLNIFKVANGLLQCV